MSDCFSLPVFHPCYKNTINVWRVESFKRDILLTILEESWRYFLFIHQTCVREYRLHLFHFRCIMGRENASSSDLLITFFDHLRFHMLIRSIQHDLLTTFLLCRAFINFDYRFYICKDMNFDKYIKYEIFRKLIHNFWSFSLYFALNINL